MHIVAFYTDRTQYVHQVEEWRYSFKDYDTMVYKIENQGSWEKNCAQKSRVIKYALEDLNDDILYLDIDARLQRPLESIQIPRLPGFCIWQPPWKANGEKELLSGTIYFPNNEISKNLINDWIEEQEKDETIWDQKTLQKVVDREDYPYFKFNLNWVAIQKFMKLADPIIVHGQISRKLKNTVPKV